MATHTASNRSQLQRTTANGRVLRHVLAAWTVLVVLGAFSTGCSTTPTYEAPATTGNIETRFLTNIDEVDRTRWHHHRSSNIHRYGGMPLDIYVGQSLDDPSNTWLRMRVYWSGIRWMFLDGITITTDGVRHDLSNLRFERDIPSRTSARVTERVDMAVGAKHLQIIRAMIESDVAVLRLRGSRGSRDYTLSDRDRVAFEDVLTAHGMLQRGEKP